MELVLLDIEDAAAWLTDMRWIVLDFDGAFAQYLEHFYFKPGTPKNAEFEVMLAPVLVNGLSGLAAFYRIRDTVENREAFRAAIAEFHEKRLLTLAELDSIIESLRRDIRENIILKLR